MLTKRARWLLGVSLLLCAAAAAYYWLGPAPTPAGQLSLTSLDGSGLAAFEQMFDASSERVRVVALLSPT